MDKFDSIQVPDGIEITAFRWNQWYTCYFKGTTLVLPDNKGMINRTDIIEVNALPGNDHKIAMEFAKKLREMGYEKAS